MYFIDHTSNVYLSLHLKYANKLLCRQFPSNRRMSAQNGSHICYISYAISLDVVCTDDKDVVWNAETARPVVQRAHALLAESNQQEFAVKVHNN